MNGFGTCKLRRTTRRWQPWVSLPWPLLFVMQVLKIRTKQTHKNGPDERLNSSKYLPGAKEGLKDNDECVNTSVEKVSSQSWLGVFASRYLIYILILIFIQVLITDFPLCVRKLTTTTTSGVD